ncbi:MAG: hypothetical protein UR73_C0037G0015 [candidate division WS6 bacterium GW2011_GWF1_35_23]|uniref:DUF1376 domain-containing protein n=1 Tax=candidate division WS6 bacterium GW2011_GWF1_35_23 TaxID=1619097 RepID=A0A0G0CFC0_9BACT|nr:MAG: hypothetical protein UR73_C0037G0015 [candidate division WS6 bacterium GW2011_GWF1_35_23]
MAKDPAFLLYSSDFLTGIMFMSDEQVGKYIKLLCAQHQKGMLAEEDMLNICKTYDKKIFEKFKKTQDGLYYNERLSVEVERRKSYSESRRNNRNSKKSKEHMSNISSTYVKHMETVTINKDINIDGITDEQMQTLWIKTFGKNPSYPEREETEKLIEKFGENKWNKQ